MSTISEIAHDLVARCQRFDFAGAMDAHYHPDIESVEGDGSMPGAGRVRGVQACKDKGAYWQSAHEVHSMQTFGPYLGDGAFSVVYDMDVTVKATGQRMQGREVAYYRVQDGKIVYENFMSAPM
ncbi:MAG: nuclear transport factor 2 family protein [Gemmatimonadaceae bacterium]|jgi:ketosteroid isomerase-like protein|nr:nuclear transport factor 2 family protein [Gemmatimonadaceae bacterium]